MSHPLQLEGYRSGALRAVRRAGSTDLGQALWECACDCGGRCTVTAYELHSRHRRSCGCRGVGKYRRKTT